MTFEELYPHLKAFVGGGTVALWVYFIRFHFKHKWKMYKQMFEWPKPEPIFKNVKYHYLRNYCEECDPIPEKKDGETLGCPNCKANLTPQTMTLPVVHGSGIVAYETKQTGWYCEWCRSKWSDETVRRVQTKFHKANKADTHGPSANPAGTFPGCENWQSYRFYPGGTYSRPSGVIDLGHSLLGNAAAQGAAVLHGDALAQAISPTFFDKGALAGLMPPDEGYGDS